MLSLSLHEIKALEHEFQERHINITWIQKMIHIKIKIKFHAIKILLKSN